MVTNEDPSGVVVPNSDGVVVPTTAPATCANTADVSCWRGERVSDELLSAETSTCKYSAELFVKFILSGVGYPLAVSPIFTVKTPCVTVVVVVATVPVGQIRFPAPTVGLSQIENLK